MKRIAGIAGIAGSPESKNKILLKMNADDTDRETGKIFSLEGELILRATLERNATDHIGGEGTPPLLLCIFAVRA